MGRWADEQGNRIEAGQVTHVTQALSFPKSKQQQTRKLISDLKEYLANNRDRMKYPEYRARGLRTSWRAPPVPI